MALSNSTLLAQRRHLVTYHNQARGSGKPALIQHSTLNQLAQNYANQVASKNWFRADAYHTRPNGMCFAQWWTAKAPAAWTCGPGCNPSCKKAIAENLARYQRNASEVHRDWMRSPSHRANILNRTYRYIGIGIADSRAGHRYWVVHFLGA